MDKCENVINKRLAAKQTGYLDLHQRSNTWLSLVWWHNVGYEHYKLLSYCQLNR